MKECVEDVRVPGLVGFDSEDSGTGEVAEETEVVVCSEDDVVDFVEAACRLLVYQQK